MQNGCICCTLREDLLIELKKLCDSNKFDYILIESTGISEPLPVAETFTFGIIENTKNKYHKHNHDNKNGGHSHEHKKAIKVLDDVAKLDTMVTVVDANQFENYLNEDDTLFEQWGKKESGIDENEERTVCHLLIDQIEFANVILINK
eukprot:UN26214